MKFWSVLLILFLFTSCNKQIKEKPSFLIGKWKRLNEKPDKTTYEFWEKDFTGLGFTLKEKDTTFKETLSIVSKKDSLYLCVDGVNEKPTFFKFTNQTDTSFVCVNNKNEFPKNIQYWISEKKLHAKAWNNDEHEIVFYFQKID